MRRIGLTSRARRATAAVAEALFATGSGPPEARQVAWLVQDLEHFLVHAGPRTRFFYRAVLLVTSLWAPLRVGRLPPLRRLPRPLRLEALRRLEASPRGAGVVTAAKSALSLFWFEQPEVAHGLGWRGRGPRTAAAEAAVAASSGAPTEGPSGKRPAALPDGRCDAPPASDGELVAGEGPHAEPAPGTRPSRGRTAAGGSR